MIDDIERNDCSTSYYRDCEHDTGLKILPIWAKGSVTSSAFSTLSWKKSCLKRTFRLEKIHFGAEFHKIWTESSFWTFEMNAFNAPKKMVSRGKFSVKWWLKSNLLLFKNWKVHQSWKYRTRLCFRSLNRLDRWRQTWYNCYDMFGFL